MSEQQEEKDSADPLMWVPLLMVQMSSFEKRLSTVERQLSTLRSSQRRRKLSPRTIAVWLAILAPIIGVIIAAVMMYQAGWIGNQ